MSGNGEPPAGWWQGPDGRWFPPQVHPDPAWRTLFAAGPTLAVSGRAGQEPTFPLESTFPLEPARPFEPGFPLEPGFPGEGPTDAPAAGPVRLWGLSRRVAGLPAWGWLVSGLTGALLAVAVLLPGDPPAVSDPSVALASGGPGARGVVAAGLSDATPVAPDRSAPEAPDRSDPEATPAARAVSDPPPGGGEATGPAPASRPATGPASPVASPAVAAPIPALATTSGAAPSPAPTHHEGSGSGRLALTKPGPGVVVAQVSHGGAGPFTVHAVDGASGRRELVAGSVGPYRGSRLLDADGGESVSLEVRADGPWAVDLVPLAAAPSWNGLEPLGGRGDAVVIVPGGLDRFTVAQVVHGGARSFAVWAYSATSRDLVANGVGHHDGRHALAAGVVLVVVSADGPWSITPRSS